jgi:pimeloyl-ACP methyl ester carboxylesterase
MHSDDFSYEIMAQDVYEYCHTHNLETINIIGHLGGKVAMLLATSHPELVDKLIVILDQILSPTPSRYIGGIECC